MAAKKTSKKPSAAAKKRASTKRRGIRSIKLGYGPSDGEETRFNRADLIFSGVDHADMSYEVRVFLNNRKADDTTPRRPESGYAGRFVIFGHGKCLGEEGHCDAAQAVRANYDLLRQHPVAPQRKTLTITDPLRRVLSGPRKKLETVTLVPISKDPNRNKRGLSASLFKFDHVELQTYR